MDNFHPFPSEVPAPNKVVLVHRFFVPQSGAIKGMRKRESLRGYRTSAQVYRGDDPRKGCAWHAEDGKVFWSDITCEGWSEI